MIEEGTRKEILEDDYEKHRALADKLREEGQFDRAASLYRKSAKLLVDLAEMESSERLANRRKQLAVNLRDAADSLAGGEPATGGGGTEGHTARSDTDRQGEPGGPGRSSGDHSSGGQRHEADEEVLEAEEFLEEPPDLTFDDVGGMGELKQTLIDKVIDPLERTELYEAYDLGVVNAVLLYGPPGTGKTYISRALAGKLDYNFIEARPSDVTSSLVGEAAENVATLFEVARDNQPCMVFLDEIEALAPKRAGGAQKTQSERQMINQLLTELTENRGEDVIVVAATNLPDEIDGAATSRFQERVEVPPPDPEARVAVLRVHLRDRPVLTDDLDWERVKELTEGYSARDLELVAAEAARKALADAKVADADVEPITQTHLEAAIEETSSSLEEWDG